jgi:hypothetical protein
MLAVLNEVTPTQSERQKDYKTAKHCVELSQTLRNGEDQPLQKLVQGHTVWRNPELWENILRVSIDDELQQQEKYGLSNLSVEEVTSRLQNAVFCQLGTFASILQSFKVDFNFAGEIISRFAFKYQLTIADLNTLEAILSKCYAVPSPFDSGVVRGVPTWVKEFDGRTHDLLRRTDELTEKARKQEEDEELAREIVADTGEVESEEMAIEPRAAEEVHSSSDPEREEMSLEPRAAQEAHSSSDPARESEEMSIELRAAEEAHSSSDPERKVEEESDQSPPEILEVLSEEDLKIEESRV